MIAIILGVLFGAFLAIINDSLPIPLGFGNPKQLLLNSVNGMFLLTGNSVSRADNLIEYSGFQQLESLFHGRPAITASKVTLNPDESRTALAIYTASKDASIEPHFWLVATAVYAFIACILVKLLADALFISESELEEIAHNEAVYCAVQDETCDGCTWMEAAAGGGVGFLLLELAKRVLLGDTNEFEVQKYKTQVPPSHESNKPFVLPAEVLILWGSHYARVQSDEKAIPSQ